MACLATGACEVVLGDLPVAKEDLPATGSTDSTTGDAGAAGQSTSATTGGAAGAGGAGGATVTTTTTTTSTTQSACCDCDGDSHDAEGACGGDDCDDDDPTTHPGADYQTEATNKGGYDHDCSKTTDPDPAYYKLIQCGLIGLPCNQKQGFLGAIPACGGAGDWGTCQGSVIPCSNQILEMGKKLPCK